MVTTNGAGDDVGLVLGGRGAWRVCLGGVVGAVVELKDRVGVIVGTSAGALIAALFGHANQEARSATRMEPRPQRRHNGDTTVLSSPVRSYPRRGRRARCRTTGLGARERLFITVAGYKSTTDDYYNYSDQGVLRSVFEPRNQEPQLRPARHAAGAAPYALLAMMRASAGMHSRLRSQTLLGHPERGLSARSQKRRMVVCPNPTGRFATRRVVDGSSGRSRV